MLRPPIHPVSLDSPSVDARAMGRHGETVPIGEGDR